MDESWLDELKLGKKAITAGHFDSARAHLERAASGAGRGESWGAQAEALSELGWAHDQLGRYDLAVSTYEQALGICDKHAISDPGLVGGLLNNLGMAWRARGNFEKARDYYGKAEAIAHKAFGRASRAGATAAYNQAEMLVELGQYDEAEAYVTAVLDVAREHSDAQDTMANLLGIRARIRRRQGNLDEALGDAQSRLAIITKVRGAGHPEVAGALAGVAAVLAAQGKLVPAEREMKKAVATTRASLGYAHPVLAGQLLQLATLEHQLGKGESARVNVEAALQVLKGGVASNDLDVARALKQRADYSRCPGSLEDYRAALRIAEPKLPPSHELIENLRAEIGECSAQKIHAPRK